MRRITAPLLAALAFLISAVLSGPTPAQSGPGAEPEFEIIANTIDAGGGTSTGGGFELTGTIAQPDASTRTSSGGEFLLAGGFWAKAMDRIFANSFEGP